MFKIGSKIRAEMESLTHDQIAEAIADLEEASADDPIYKRGFAIGGMRLSDSSRNTAGTTSPQSKDSSPGQKGSSTKQGWTEEEFQKGEEALANLMKQNPPKILSD